MATTKCLEALANMEYPGRVIILGTDRYMRNSIAVYAITGRSPSSQARRLVMKDDGNIWTVPTDEKTLQQGDARLLIYPAIMLCFDDKKSYGIAVSNGIQTKEMKDNINAGYEGIKCISLALKKWGYEPDSPNYTPRIGGVIKADPNNSIALGIIRKGEGYEAKTKCFKIGIEKGYGSMITTYAGANENPLPSFKGAPADVRLTGKTASDIAENVYEALAPKDPSKDYRVSVACVFLKLSDKKDSKPIIISEHHIINRNWVR